MLKFWLFPEVVFPWVALSQRNWIWPLQVVLSKKIGYPLHKVYAIGAVTLEGEVLVDAASEIPQDYIQQETKGIRKLLKRRFETYYGNIEPLEYKDKVLIIVDDGIATGNTIFSTIQMLADEKPEEIIITVPVASRNAIDKLQNSTLVNEVICLSVPSDFRAVGQYYINFDQADDAKVKELLKKTIPAWIDKCLKNVFKDFTQ